MNKKINRLGLILLASGALFMVGVSTILVLLSLTNYNALIIRDIHTILLKVYFYISPVEKIFKLLFLIGIVFLTNNTFKDSVQTAMRGFAIIIAIIYFVYLIFYFSNIATKTNLHIYDTYNILFTIFCLAFVACLLLFETNIKYGILILCAFILQIFVFDLQILGRYRFFVILRNAFKNLFQGLSYLLFSVHAFKKF